MKNALGLPVYVFLVPVAGILTLYANNSSHVEISQVIITLFAALALTAPLLLGGKLIFGNWHRPSLILGLNYIHLFLTSSVDGWPMAKFTAVLAALSVILLFKYHEGLAGTAPVLNLAAAALVAIPATTLVFSLRHTAGEALRKGEPPAAELKIREDAPQNIFFILVDGYARADVLERYYRFDNSGFEDELRNLGFHVAERSWTNYSQTTHSIASLLNFNYIDQLIDTEPLAQRKNLGFLSSLINSSRFLHTLEQAGYETVAFKTGYSIAELKSVDSVISFGISTASTCSTLAMRAPRG